MALPGHRLFPYAPGRHGAALHPGFPSSRQTAGKNRGRGHTLPGGVHRPGGNPGHREHRRSGHCHCGRGAGSGVLDVVFRPAGDGHQVFRGPSGGGVPGPGPGGPLAGRPYGVPLPGAGDALAGRGVLYLLRSGLLWRGKRRPGRGGGPGDGPGVRGAASGKRGGYGGSLRAGHPGGAEESGPLRQGSFL